MYLKINTLRFIFLLLSFYSMLWRTSAYCSLEKMKKFAMEACEHIFLEDEAREKRSLSYDNNLIDDENDHIRIRNGKHYTTVSRGTYPRGGYLKVSRDHYQKLTQVNVFPKYKAKKLHFEKQLGGERYKREHAPTYNNIPYCCYNRCEEDFFC